jgi:predicted DsbA family dithiol-disulfide isomerase
MQVEIWSDVVCPWCYIGKRRFESALARFAHRDEVRVVYRSFELDSHAPRHSDRTTHEVLASKYGISLQRAAAMNERVTQLAAAEGLDYQLDRTRYTNTFDAHRMIHLAAAHSLQAEAHERLMRAYFTEGEDVADAETLARLLTEVGVSADEVRAALTSDAYGDGVREDLLRARGFGIDGVPFFVIDEQYGISGAQPTELLLTALNEIWAESRPVTLVEATADTDLCADASCALPAPAEATTDATA